ncbi:Hypothetical protein SMAX5B_021434 [Scophthalmus maximus]|uniref:Uncharacterized protein n=1 Tax=Scophthalmus maximus TaxID=52904 RepID=A0A2U9B1D4_SCOMX|nr:Hypothetical protein SMAX5B_021434 [Scophthalmus maximus]
MALFLLNMASSALPATFHGPSLLTLVETVKLSVPEKLYGPNQLYLGGGGNSFRWYNPSAALSGRGCAVNFKRSQLTGQLSGCEVKVKRPTGNPPESPDYPFRPYK